MSKLDKVILGGGVFLLLSGGLLSLAGRSMGAETHLNLDTKYGAVYLSPFGIHDISVNTDRVDIGGDDGIHVGPDGVRLGGDNGIRVGPDGVHLGGWTLSDYTDVDASQPTWEVPRDFKGKEQTLVGEDLSAFTALDADIDISDLIVQYGEHYSVELRWYADNGYSMSYSTEGGVLKLTDHAPAQNRGNHQCAGFAVVTLPQGTRLTSVDVEVDMGDVYLDNLSVDRATVKCSMGHLTALGVTAGDLDLSADMGSVDVLGGDITGTLTLNASMGSAYLQGNFTCDLDISADMGSVELFTDQPQDAYRYTFDADMGDVTVNGESRRRDETINGGSGPYTMKVAASMGSLDVWFEGGNAAEAAESFERTNDLPHYLYGYYPEYENKDRGLFANTLSYSFNVDEDMELTIETEYYSGELELGIRRQGLGGWVYDMRSLDGDSDTVELQPGRYELVIKASAFQGSYTVLGEPI